MTKKTESNKEKIYNSNNDTKKVNKNEIRQLMNNIRVDILKEKLTRFIKALRIR